MINRRQFLRSGGAWSATGLLGGAGLLSALSAPGTAAASDYKAVVVLHLNGGSDGHNMLVPTDGAYKDYQTARANLALSKNSLVPLAGTAADHTFAVHPSLAPFAPLYANKRLAFIANVGPLAEPSTAQQVLDGAVEVPPFLFSHSDQVTIQQGWTLTDDSSGWAGRGLEQLPSELRHPISAVALNNDRTLVLGQHSPVSFLSGDGSRWWGTADLANPQTESAQSLYRMARWQFGNTYEAEFARTFGAALEDATRFTKATMASTTPGNDFGSGYLADRLRQLAGLLPVFKSQGLRRQVFLMHWGGFDTHAGQRGSGPNTQDTQFIEMGKAVSAFDAAMLAAGLGDDVLVLMMTDFGRTLRPGSGGGSEHAWGNHWFALGGPVNGGTVHGTFPTLKLGGVDDCDAGKNGRLAPAVATDQVGAAVMQWMGMPANVVLDVFPSLVRFPQRTLASLLRA